MNALELALAAGYREHCERMRRTQRGRAWAQTSGAMDGAHRNGRKILLGAWPLVWPGVMPTLPELQIAGAVATLEGGYGHGVYKLLEHGPGSVEAGTYGQVLSTVSDSNNWGAVQCKKGPPCDADCFMTTDSDPKKRSPANPRGLFDWCYRRYPTPEAGAAHIVKLLTRDRPGSHAAMRAGDVDAFSADMYRTHYYGGFHLEPSRAIDEHAKTVMRHATDIAAAMGEPLSVRRGGGGVAIPGAQMPSGNAGAGGGGAAVVLVAAALAAGAAWALRSGRRAA